MNDPGPTTIMMPPGPELRAALWTTFPNPHMRQHLYPNIVRPLADNLRTAEDIAITLYEALRSYRRRAGPAALLGADLAELAPTFIRAIAPEELREDTLRIWRQRYHTQF